MIRATSAGVFSVGSALSVQMIQRMLTKWLLPISALRERLGVALGGPPRPSMPSAYPLAMLG